MMIGRLLCRLGWHRYPGRWTSDDEGIYWTCMRCGRTWK